MGIYAETQLDAATGREGQIGRRLAEQCDEHFSNFYLKPQNRPKGDEYGLGYGSCNAAVAIEQVPQGYSPYVYMTGSDVKGLFANSRMYLGLDPDERDRLAEMGLNPCNPYSSSDREQHAEQIAILLAEWRQLRFSRLTGIGFIYVDLAPCPRCRTWLEGHCDEWWVFYRFPYSDTGNSAVLEKYHRSYRPS
jgi:hypothetical protein